MDMRFLLMVCGRSGFHLIPPLLLIEQALFTAGPNDEKDGLFGYLYQEIKVGGELKMQNAKVKSKKVVDCGVHFLLCILIYSLYRCKDLVRHVGPRHLSRLFHHRYIQRENAKVKSKKLADRGVRFLLCTFNFYYSLYRCNGLVRHVVRRRFTLISLPLYSITTNRLFQGRSFVLGLTKPLSLHGGPAQVLLQPMEIKFSSGTSANWISFCIINSGKLLASMKSNHCKIFIHRTKYWT